MDYIGNGATKRSGRIMQRLERPLLVTAAVLQFVIVVGLVLL
jgi:hypothetical protein